MAIDELTQSGNALIPELAEHVAAFEAAKKEMQGLIADLDDAQFNWRPDGDRWSMAECFDHLCMLGPRIVPLLDVGIEEATTKNWRGEGPFKYGVIGNFFIRLAGPNTKRKFKAPGAFTPSSNHTKSRLVSSYTAMQDDFIARARMANGFDLARPKMRNPTLPILRMSLGQWFALLAGHQQRHYQQAVEVKRAMETASVPS